MFSNVEQVCRHFGMKLLREQSTWLSDDFMTRWQADVPEVSTSTRLRPSSAYISLKIKKDSANLFVQDVLLQIGAHSYVDCRA